MGRGWWRKGEGDGHVVGEEGRGGAAAVEATGLDGST